MWRTERKMSRITLGEAIGLTDQQIQKYEKGTHRIGASRLQQICAVLEIPVSFLFEGELGPSPGESGMPQDIIDFMESEEGVRFVAAFSRITDRKMRRGIARLASLSLISGDQGLRRGAKQYLGFAGLTNRGRRFDCRAGNSVHQLALEFGQACPDSLPLLWSRAAAHLFDAVTPKSTQGIHELHVLQVAACHTSLV